MAGIRARLTVEEPPNCPVVELATEDDARIRDVNWTANSGGTVVEEFRATSAVDAATVFDAGENTVHRVERDNDADCPCETVEALGCPVADVRVEKNCLSLTLHLPSTDPLSGVVEELEELGGVVRLRYLVRDAEAEGTDATVVDRDRLTTRQREVLRTAYRLGYFAYPRESSAEEVAASLDIGTSTFAEHLAAAQSTLLEEVFEE